MIITNVTIGPGTTAFVSPDATSRIAASALAAGHPRRHRPHRRRHLCLHPPSALPPPPYAFATLTIPTVTASTLIPTTVARYELESLFQAPAEGGGTKRAVTMGLHSKYRVGG